MKKKNIHLQKYLKGPLPEPEVSADDAWAEMNGMLGGKTSNKKGENIRKFIAMLLGLMGIVLIVWVLYPDSGNERRKTAGNVKFEESGKPGQRVSVKTKKENTEKENQHSGSEKNVENISELLPEKNDKKETEVLSRAGNHVLENDEPVASRGKKDKRNKSFSVKNSVVKNGRKGVGEEMGEGEDNGGRRAAAITANTEKTAAYAKGKSTAKTTDTGFTKQVDLLQSRPFYFSVLKNTMTIHNHAAKPQHLSKNERLPTPMQSFLRTIHFGLEWNAASSFRDTRYIFAGTDSVSRPYLLAIPGLWLNKGVGRNQSVTLGIFAYQPYFGGLRQVGHEKDSIPGPDSTFSYRQTKLVKAAGFNASVQYNYHFSSLGMLSAGFGYSAFSSALLREDFQNHASEVYAGPLVSVRKNEIGKFINTNLLTFKTGLTFTPGRFQLGVNLVIPITNLSLSETSLRTVNGQVLIRYRIK